jgi:cytochrome P450
MDPMPAEVQRFASFFLAMDPLKHNVHRRLISSAFTPRNVKRIEDQIHAAAVRVVDDLVGAGEVDFVAACSTRLPKSSSAQAMTSTRPSRTGRRTPSTRYSSSTTAGCELATHRRAHPADDLMTAMVNAEVDGQRLTDEEMGAFMVLRASAVNDTTKQATTHAMLALVANPDQRAWLMADFDNRIGPAVEEFTRYSTPVLQFARFVTEDTELGGQRVEAGDKIGLFHCSANRDEAVFDDPHGFDLSRSPNPHLGFGGGGPHFRLGSQVAKVELRNLFGELLTRLTRVEFGEPDYLRSSFVHGVKRLPAHVE